MPRLPGFVLQQSDTDPELFLCADDPHGTNSHWMSGETIAFEILVFHRKYFSVEQTETGPVQGEEIRAVVELAAP